MDVLIIYYYYFNDRLLGNTIRRDVDPFIIKLTLRTTLYRCLFYHSHTYTRVFLYILQDEVADKAIKLTTRERRFIKFASVEFDGQIYMTPQDFLESVVEQEPRRKW
jgi:hypothetical protein